MTVGLPLGVHLVLLRLSQFRKTRQISSMATRIFLQCSRLPRTTLQSATLGCAPKSLPNLPPWGRDCFRTSRPLSQLRRWILTHFLVTSLGLPCLDLETQETKTSVTVPRHLARLTSKTRTIGGHLVVSRNILETRMHQGATWAAQVIEEEKRLAILSQSISPNQPLR